MALDPTVVPNVSPKERARIRGHVPFLFLLQELKSGRPLLLKRSGADAALSCRDAAVGLHLCGVRVVIGGKLVSCLNGSVAVAEAVSVSRRASWKKANQGNHGQNGKGMPRPQDGEEATSEPPLGVSLSSGGGPMFPRVCGVR